MYDKVDDIFNEMKIIKKFHSIRIIGIIFPNSLSKIQGDSKIRVAYYLVALVSLARKLYRKFRCAVDCQRGRGGEGGGAIALTMVNTITPVACFIQTIGSNIKAFFTVYYVDLDGVPVMDRVEVVGGHISLPCTGVQHYSLNRYRVTALHS